MLLDRLLNRNFSISLGGNRMIHVPSSSSRTSRRHPRESGDPGIRRTILWIPAFAGMTVACFTQIY